MFNSEEPHPPFVDETWREWEAKNAPKFRRSQIRYNKRSCLYMVMTRTKRGLCICNTPHFNEAKLCAYAYDHFYRERDHAA